MDLLIISSIILSFIIILLTYFGFVRKSAEKKENEPRQRPAPNVARDGAPRRAQMLRNRGARMRANVAAQAQDSDEDNGAVGDDEPDVDAADLKIGAKKRAKLEAKAEKKAQREADEQVRTDKKKRDQQAEEDRKKVEDKERADEKRKEDEIRKAREDKERREHEEYLKMKEAFSVEEEGYEEGETTDEQNLLQEFVGYIKNQKVIIIEDLAAHFKLKTQAVIDRIKDLQNDNILTGVLDDRGKFIYVSQEEMEAVAKFIKQRGRVSIQELAENSNRLINLTPTIANVN